MKETSVMTDTIDMRIVILTVMRSDAEDVIC